MGHAFSVPFILSWFEQSLSLFFFLPRFRQTQTSMGKAIFLNIGFVVVVIKAVTSKLSLNFLQLLYSRFLVKLSSWLKKHLFSEYWRLINLLPFYWHLVVVAVQKLFKQANFSCSIIIDVFGFQNFPDSVVQSTLIQRPLLVSDHLP